MSDDELSKEQMRKIEASLLGYDVSQSTTVSVRKSRRVSKPLKPQPHIEIQPRSVEWGLLYDFYLVSELGRHVILRGLDEEDAKSEVKKYRADGAEVKMAG